MPWHRQPSRTPVGSQGVFSIFVLVLAIGAVVDQEPTVRRVRGTISDQCSNPLDRAVVDQPASSEIIANEIDKLIQGRTEN